MTTDLDLEVISAGFDEMTRLDIVIAPWMAMGHDRERLNEDQRIQLYEMSYELSTLYKHAKVLWWTTEALPQPYLQHVYYATILSTAAYLSYMRLGTLVITDEMIWVAYRLVKNYAQHDGGSVILSFYVRAMFYLSGELLDYYGQVPQEIFVSGAWHRPWTERPLEYELEYALKNDLFVQHVKGGQTFVKLTKRGKDLFLASRSFLEGCGYLKQRERLMRAAAFTNMEDYERIVEQMNPDIHINRESVLQRSGITAGMKVLELGCGAGALTFDDGLYQVVGLEGRVIATDPSVGMLSRAKNKQQKYGAYNVEFVQAAAESLPFEDNSFDAVVGFLFLHFCDIAQAFQEIRRVTKPGGTFTTLYVLDFSKGQDFFFEWFEPVFKRGLGAKSKNVMPQEHAVPGIAGEYFATFDCETEEWALNLDHVESSVKFLIEIGTMVETHELPWRARQELINELVQRGYSVRGKYGKDQMKLSNKGQWFHGTVGK